MTSSYTYMSLYYVFISMMFYGSNSLFSFWILMEMNLLSFLMIIYFIEGKNQDFFFYGLFYFLFQSLGSILFLFGISLGNSMSFEYHSNMLVFISLILKLGIFPGSFWVFQMGSFLSFQSIYFLLVLQKIPLFLLVFNLGFLSLEIILWFSFIYGALTLFFSKSLSDLLISSSISSSFWVYFLFSDSMFMFISFFFFYSLTFLLLFFSFSKGFSFSSITLFCLSSFMFLSGLPPLSLFFFKYNVSSFLSSTFYSFEFLSFFLISFIGLFGYLSFFYKNFFFLDFLYLNNEFSLKKMSFFMSVIFFSIFFFF